MFDPPIVAAGSSCDRARDDVETDAPRKKAPMAGQPGARGADHSLLLSSVDRQFGRTEAVVRACLDLDERDEVVMPHDEIDFDAVVTDVVLHDAIPSLDEECGSTALALSPELASGVAARPGSGVRRRSLVSSTHRGLPRDRGCEG